VVKVEKLYCSIDSAVSILARAGQSRVVERAIAPVNGCDGGVWKDEREGDRESQEKKKRRRRRRSRRRRRRRRRVEE
jgi:hypothetical protein